MSLQDDALEIGLGVGLVVVASAVIGALKAAKAVAPAVGAVGKVVGAVTASPLDVYYGGNVTNATNAAIDLWFSASHGFLGLFGWDPTNWTAFRAGASPYWIRDYLPQYQTGYFSAKVAQYQGRSYTTPGGLGY